jgi:hypothetical protein
MPTFRLNPAPTFEADVLLTVPGAVESFRLPVTFKHHSRSAFDALVAKAGEAEKAGQAMPAADWLCHLLADWGPVVVDDNDKPIPFSRDALAKLLDNYPGAFVQINAAYGRALVEARAKN